MSQIALRAIYRPSYEALEYSQLGLNLYKGCSHSCKYCFNRGRFDGPCTDRNGKATLQNVSLDLYFMKKYGDNTPVHISFVGDPYDLGRPDNSHTREVLKLFMEYGHPFQILTKGGTLAARDFDLYKPGDRFGVTLTFDNDQDSLKWEPGAALPADRIAALKQAHEMGIETWVSLEPVIDPAQTLHLIELSAPYTDFYGVGKLNHDYRAKTIDWAKFRADAEDMLKKHGKAYKIKAALEMAAKGWAAKPTTSMTKIGPHIRTSTLASHAKDPNAVRIVLKPGKYSWVKTYDKLSPSQELFDHWQAHHDSVYYTAEYQKQLDRLDPHQVVKELLDLAPEPILLCFCKPGQFCHRRLVARWLEDALGIEVAEINMQRDPEPMKILA